MSRFKSIPCTVHQYDVITTSDIVQHTTFSISRPRFERFRRNMAQWRSSILLTVPTVKNLKFCKSQMAAAAVLKNPKIVISRQRFDWSPQNLAWCSWCVPLLKICNFKNPTWRRPPFWKIEKLPYLGCSFNDFDEIWHGGLQRETVGIIAARFHG